MTERCDFLVIGGGIAGLTFALNVAKHGKVALVLKDDFNYSSTQHAQGGINAVLSADDSFASHAKDTIDCGYGLCHPEVVEKVVAEGPTTIQELINIGVQFTQSAQGLALHREGGHAHSRVVHAQDATGAEIMRALVHAVEHEPQIAIYKNHMAIDLIFQYQAGCRYINEHSRILGAYVLETQTNRVLVFESPVVYLATGGLGKVYPYTSNPHTATGDGIAMAYRGGLDIVNMEFIQFHPTLLYHPKERSWLISEAVRGEGGILKNVRGEAFMGRYHPQLKDLAPRDVVARAIDSEIKQTGHPCVYLDVTHLPSEHIREHFPTIHAHLLALGIDITQEPIPVTPGAHYACGGLAVDLNGETSCKGLFAGGECSFTGLHGANRLASNSLLEAAVYAKWSASHIAAHLETYRLGHRPQIAPWVYHDYSDAFEESLVQALWYEMRHFLWNYVGIVRTKKRLKRAARRIRSIRREIEDSYWNFRISKDLVELRNISIIAELIVESARLRKESRGLHFNADFPDTDPAYAQDTVLSKKRMGLFR
jgi:L-aspartate oxidase